MSDTQTAYIAVSFPAEVIDAMCDRLAQGETLTAVCRGEGMPAWQTVMDWLEEEASPVAIRIRRARIAGQHAIAERARQTLRGKGPEEGGESTKDIKRDKAIAEFDLKLLARQNPREFGENVQLRHADADGEKLDTSGLVRDVMALVKGGTVDPTDPGA